MKEEEVAIKAAKVAGSIAMDYFKKPIEKRRKSLKEIVTEADFACEKRIKKILQKEFPDYSFLGEETGSVEKKSEFVWVVDPIDGTNNFAHRFPYFCISIGLAKDNLPVAGVVYNPVLKDLYYAERGKGAYLNGERISVSKNKKLIDCLVETGFPYEEMNLAQKTLQHISKLLGKINGIRRSGSAALDMCYIARGAVDAFFCYALKPWDITAATIILEEAGGKITNFKGDSYNVFTSDIVASNGFVHKELLREMEV